MLWQNKNCIGTTVFWYNSVFEKSITPWSTAIPNWQPDRSGKIKYESCLLFRPTTLDSKAVTPSFNVAYQSLVASRIGPWRWRCLALPFLVVFRDSVVVFRVSGASPSALKA